MGTQSEALSHRHGERLLDARAFGAIYQWYKPGFGKELVLEMTASSLARLTAYYQIVS